MGIILRVWDNSGKSKELSLAEFIDSGPLSGDSRFNMEAPTVKNESKVLMAG